MTDLLQEIPEKTAGNPPEFALATVASVQSGGVKLIFDGQSEASQKTYKCNAAISFKEGDRVKIHKDAGTYIVEYPVGAPASRVTVPNGGPTGYVLTKNSVQDQDVSWKPVALADSVYSVQMIGSVVTPNFSAISLGSSDKPFGDLYALGNVNLCSSLATSKLSFFGHAASSQQSVANNATVATLITALKAYGLIK